MSGDGMVVWIRATFFLASSQTDDYKRKTQTKSGMFSPGNERLGKIGRGGVYKR